ncbi:MAG: hypothetical protein ACFFDI_26085 [Promethearchaeota archaeon]
MKCLIKITTIFLGIVILVINPLKATDPKLALEIRTSKEVFLRSEPIWIDAILSNISQDTVRVYGLCLPCQSIFRVEVIDEQGNALKYTGSVYDMIPGSGWIMHPGDRYFKCLNLLNHFYQYKNLVELVFLKSLQPGRYTVKARYETANSNELEFEVKEPEQLEKEAYQLVKDAYYSQTKKPDSTSAYFKQLVNSFPKSAYAEIGYKELYYDKELLENFPNSGYTENALVRLTDTLSLEQKHKSLHEVINKHPSTRSAKFAEKMLKKIEDQKQ